MYLVALFIGLVMLVGGAEVLVRGGSQLALAFRVPALVVGLTIVSFGTSTPELATSLNAALKPTLETTEMALANVNGSNIANILLVLGAAALVRPLRVERSLLRREIPTLILLQALVPLFCYGGFVRWYEGVILLIIGLGFNVLLLAQSIKQRGDAAEALRREAIDEIGDASGGIILNCAYLVVGIGILVAGAWLFIDGAVVLARNLEVDDRFIGLTCVALGTSAPELATAIVSAYRGEIDLAIGNSIGSNILNISMVLATTSLLTPVQLGDPAAWYDLGLALLATFFVGGVIIAGGRLGRLAGGLMIAAYLAYIFIVSV